MRVVGRWKRATDVRMLIAGIVCIVVIVVIELAVPTARRIIIEDLGVDILSTSPQL